MSEWSLDSVWGFSRLFSMGCFDSLNLLDGKLRLGPSQRIKGYFVPGKQTALEKAGTLQSRGMRRVYDWRSSPKCRPLAGTFKLK